MNTYLEKEQMANEDYNLPFNITHYAKITKEILKIFAHYQENGRFLEKNLHKNSYDVTKLFREWGSFKNKKIYYNELKILKKEYLHIVKKNINN